MIAFVPEVSIFYFFPELYSVDPQKLKLSAKTQDNVIVAQLALSK